jgi:dipeptidyl aminopeptidase/acylaminoacyl peptidase
LRGGRFEGPARLLFADLGDVQPFGVTKLGALFYAEMQRSSSYREIRVASIDFASGTTGSPTSIGGERPGSNEAPEWSPDGKRLAYVMTPIGSRQPAVVVRDMASRLIRELQPALRQVVGLKWSPDGKSFLTTGTNNANEAGIYRVDVQTGEATLIVLGGNQPVWSRDGASIYYRRGNRQSDSIVFVARDLKTGAERELLRRPELGPLTLSPDGRYVATGVTDTAANTRTIVVVPTSGGEAKSLRVNKPVGGGVPMWMPDSQAVIVGDGSKLWRVTLDGRESPFSPRLFPGNQIALHPDGTRIAYVATVTPENSKEPGVWVLENFLPQEKTAQAGRQAATGGRR